MPITRFYTLYTSPEDDCEAALLATAQKATKSLHVLIYGYTLEALTDLLLQKHQEGVTVGVVCDHTQSAGKKERPVLQRLVDAGVSVTIAAAPSGAILHTKALLVDILLGTDHNDSYAVSGSYNFSVSAQKEFNTLTVWNDPSVCSLIWKQYCDAEEVGKRHPHWQLTPSSPS